MTRYIILFALLLCTVQAEEADLPDPRVRVTWIGARGKTFQLNWPVASQWVLQEISHPPYKKLVIRTWLTIPAEYKLKKFTWTNRYEMNPKYSPIDAKQLVAFDQKKSIDSGRVQIEKDGKTTEYGLIVQILDNKPFPWMSRECRDQGLSVRQWRDTGKNLYFAVNCKKRGNQLDVYFQRPLDSKMAVKATGTLKKKGKDFHAYRFSLSKKPKGRKAIGAVDLKAPDVGGGSGSSFYNIYWGEKSPRKTGLRMSATLGPTLLQYTERPVIPQNVDDTSYVLTAKVAGIYRINEKIDVGGNAFGNFLTLSHTQEEVAAAKFLGVSVRGSYLLSKSSTLTLRGMLGWYYWATIGTDDTYGIGYLTGPQFMVAAVFHRLTPRPIWIYAKYAPLEQSIIPSLRKREVAGGIGYEISTSRSPRLIAITVDVAQVEVNFENALNEISLFSLSLGLQVGLSKR